MADTDVQSIFEPDIDEAEAEIDAGHFVPHAEVAKWLQSWGTPNKLPRPKSSAR